jgi:hypothetical protein
MITRKAFRGSRLKVQKEPKLPPETQIPFLNSRTDSKLIPSEERECDNRISAAAKRPHIRLAIYRFDSKSNILRKRRRSSLVSLKNDLRKFYD